MKRLIAVLLLVAVPLAAQPVAPTLRITAAGLELSVKADGTPPLEYQWRRGVLVKVPVPGGNGPVLLLRPPYAPQAGHYDIVVSNSAGSVTSEAVRVGTTTQADAPPVAVIFKESKL